MAKAQVISMDFIMAFIIFMGAVSVFFYSYQSSIKYSTFRIDPKITFSKLENMENSFLIGAKIKDIDGYLTSYDEKELYETLKDSSNANYCIYIQNSTKIYRNFAAYENENNIFFNENLCGESKFNVIQTEPECKGKEAIIIKKPVLFMGEIMSLNILACST